MDWEFGVNRCKLLYIEWIPLYSIVNYSQYPVVNHNRKVYEIYIYMTESLCCTAEVNTTL